MHLIYKLLPLRGLLPYDTDYREIQSITNQNIEILNYKFEASQENLNDIKNYENDALEYVQLENTAEPLKIVDPQFIISSKKQNSLDRNNFNVHRNNSGLENYKYIYSHPSLYDYHQYCNSSYRFYESPMNLLKVISIFKNGDKSPQNISHSKWNKRFCTVCNTKECRISHCGENQLTIKGYEQGKALGNHINSYYRQKITKSIISSYYTDDTLAISFLQSVLSAFSQENKSIEHLEKSSPCDQLISSYYQECAKDNLFFDRIASSLCNDIEMSCAGLDCSISSIGSILSDKQMQYEDNAARMRENAYLNGISFYKVARFLQERIEGPESIVLVSIDNDMLSRIISGLNIRSNIMPSYSSAVFIEIWEDLESKQFVRVIYNSEVQRIGIYQEQLVEKKDFLRYLHFFSKNINKVEQKCSNSKQFEEKTFKKIFSPLEEYFISN
jgi:hypothetical protein